MKLITLKENGIHVGNLILVNGQYPCQEHVDKYNLLPVNGETNTVLLENHVAKFLSNIMDNLDGWKQMIAVSGWRSMQEQQQIYRQSLRDNGTSFTKRYVALPGHSEHQTGLAIDLALKQEGVDFICPNFPYTGICQRFRQKAISYGFIERYPQFKEHITGIAHEPWHFRYVGMPHADIMAKHSFTLEEYIDFLKNYPYGKKHYLYDAGGMCIAVSYLKADKTADTRFELDDNIPYSVSGNNIDGFVITEWRKKNEE